MSDNTIVKIPTLTSYPKSNTTKNTIVVEVHANVGNSVYVNGIKSGIVEADGTVSITIPLNLSDNEIRITVKDTSGNESEALVLNIHTTAVNHALKIQSVEATKITQDSAYINWSLSNYATGQVEYGETTSYGLFNTKETSFKYKIHSQKLLNLKPDTTYHYRVISVDKTGKKTISQDATFKTLAELTNAFMLYPEAPLDDNGKPDTSRFIKEFPNTVKTLKDAGVNTIFFVTNRQFFRFQKDTRLKNAWYPKARGYNPKYFNSLAEIARKNNMKVVVFYNMLTHLKPDVISRTYPELMHKGTEWKTDTDYIKRGYDPDHNGFVIEHNGAIYKEIKGDTSSPDNEPGVGKNWKEYWEVSRRSLPDPLNPKIQIKFQSMLDELIEAFTVDKKRPDGVHIGGDEAWTWRSFRCDDEDLSKRQCGGMTYAQLFAAPIKKTYDYIHTNYPEMDVYIWGDMLGSYANGRYTKTADAINIIPKDIIIADWRYDPKESLGYSVRSKLFKSIKEFSDAGFHVLSAGWNNAEVAKSLFWSGKILDKTKGQYEGYLTTVWHERYWDLPNILTELKAPGSLKLTEENKNQDLDAAKDVATSMHAVKVEMDKKECSGVGDISGTYPNCYDCNAKDDFYDDKNTSYLDYSKSNASCTYKEVMIPESLKNLDPSEYTLKEGAHLVDDITHGSALSLDTPKAYAELDTPEFNGHKSGFSVSLWFKPNIPGWKKEQVLISKGKDEFQLSIISGRNAYLYVNGREYIFKPFGDNKQWEVGKWYHLTWVLNKDVQTIYLDEQTALGTNGYSNPDPSGIDFGNHNLTIGKAMESDKDYFGGRIDDVRIFDYVLNKEQVESLHTIGL